MYVRSVCPCCNQTSHIAPQPGGRAVIDLYALRPARNEDSVRPLKDASWAFGGGLNKHSRSAVNRMRGLRVARIQADVVLQGEERM